VTPSFYSLAAQVIPRDGSDPTMTLGFTVQYPYTITSWASATLTKTGAGAPANSITASFDAGTVSPVCAIGDYIAVGDNTGGTCYKDGIAVTFDKGSATDCSFDGQVYTANFNVRCATGIPDADCPLQAADTGSAEFTITSDNWYVFGGMGLLAEGVDAAKRNNFSCELSLPSQVR
jgi:hypothetical protein